MCRCEALAQASEGTTSGINFPNSLRAAEKGLCPSKDRNITLGESVSGGGNSNNSGTGSANSGGSKPLTITSAPGCVISGDRALETEPAYEITHRRFEMADVAARVLGPWGKWTFAASYLFGIFVVLVCYTQIFGTALAKTMGPAPAFAGIAQHCDDTDQMSVGQSCWPVYAVSVVIFTILGWALAIVGFKESYWVQAIFTALRVVTLFLMVVTMAADPTLDNFYGLKDSSSRWTTSDLNFWCNFSGLGKGIPILAYSRFRRIDARAVRNRKTKQDSQRHHSRTPVSLRSSPRM